LHFFLHFLRLLHQAAHAAFHHADILNVIVLITVILTLEAVILSI
jgi:pterin-4a-carbinolamine dehydratase